MVKRVALTLAILLLSTILSSCIYKEKSKKQIINDHRTIIYMTESLPEGFSSTLKGEEKNTNIYKGLFEGLLGRDEDGDITLALAEDYDVSDDGLQYTFTLRKDIYYSNGEKITSGDFLRFFQEVFHSSQEDKLSEDLRMVYGVLDYHKENTSFEGVAISAPTDDTLIFRLNYKDESFLEALAKEEYYLRPIEETVALKEAYGAINYTGAFLIEDFDDKELTLKRNPYYYESENKSKSDILIRLVHGGEEALSSFNIGLCDIFYNPPLNQISYLEKQGAAKKVFSGWTYGIKFNSDTTDTAFRRAIEKILYSSNAFYTLDGLEFSMLSYGNSFYPEKNYKDDSVFVSSTKENTMEKSYAERQVDVGMEYLRISNKEDKKKLFILSPDGERFRKIGSYIEKSLKELLEIQVSVKYVQKDKLLEESRREDYSMILSSVEALNDEAFYFSFGNINNPLFIEDEKYKSLIEGYDKVSIQDKLEINNSLKGYIEDNIIFLPLFYDLNVVCKSDNIQELVFDKEGRLILKELNKSTGDDDLQDINKPVRKSIF